ncbi:MAG: transaldolase family protein [Methanobacteriota archaeon]
MKIFVDTAKLNEIKEAIPWGIVDGVTTNPSLIRGAVEEEKKAGKNLSLDRYIGEICSAAGKGRPVSLEVVSLKASEMIGEAQTLYERFNPIAGNVTIKIPINTCADQGTADYEGLKAINNLAKKGIPVNVTLILTPEQALLAAKAGAAYVSPFAGRIDDYIRKNLGVESGKSDYFDFELIQEISRKKLNEHLSGAGAEKISSLYPDENLKKVVDAGKDNGITSGVDCVRKIVNIFKNYNIQTKVIAASIRNSRQVREVAETGCDICTIPFAVIRDMLKHPKTEEGVKKFCTDAVQAGYDEIFSRNKD